MIKNKKLIYISRKLEKIFHLFELLNFEFDTLELELVFDFEPVLDNDALLDVCLLRPLFNG